MTDLAVLYEHPLWFAPLFAALERKGVAYTAIDTHGSFDPVAPTPPAPLILNRVAMSAFLRDAEHPIFWALARLDHWQRGGAKILNGPQALAIDTSKARQLSLLTSLGLSVPRTRVVHSISDLVEAADSIGFPLLVKANIGGAGAGITRFDDREMLRAAIADNDIPRSIDSVLLVQEYVPARDGQITRIETLDRAYLYAIDIAGAGAFDLCPADACKVPGSAIQMTAAEPAQTFRDAAEAIARAAHLDLGGVEVMIDDRDGTPRFYDINALSNFVARPLDVLGWDPHDRLVDRLVDWIAETR